MLTFTPEHEQFRKVVRDLVENEINPHVDAWEEAGTFPAHELFPKLAAVGALGLEYAEEDGGQGADHSYTLVLAEELGRADCAGVPMAIAVQAAMATPALARFGSAELKARYLKPALAGELVTSIAVSEPDAGSDVAGIRTRAVRDGDDWVINGRKMWITNGTQADWLCLLARTSDEGGYAGMSMIVVPTTTPGFSVGRKIEKMGNRSSDTAELVLDDVRVPVSNTIGEIGRGFQQQMAQFQDERLIGAYMAVAGARRAIDRTLEYLRMREAFGKPLLANQAIQYRLAELVAEIDVMQSFCHSIAERVVAGQDATRAATVAKLKSGRLVRDVADACVQYHGGMGYAEEMWVARYYRDARLVSIGGGADEVMLRIITMLEGMGEAMSTEAAPAVRYEVADGVATLTLDRPDARNILDGASLTALREHLAAAAADEAVRVVVLTGTGSAFCAGADLRGATAGDAEGFAAAGPQALVDVLTAMLDHPKPLIARVQGHVAGGGNGLVAACDLAVAVDAAKFAFSEVRVGVAPAVISVVCLAKMAPSQAAELLLTGERVSAERAREAGLVQRVVPAEELDAAVAGWVDALRRGGPLALAATKELLRTVPALPRDEAFAMTAALSAGLFASEEAREGMTAFLERRPASWCPPADG